MSKNSLCSCVVLLLCIAGASITHGQPLELSLKGSITVTLGPPEAVAAGAAFQIDALASLPSGGVEGGLNPGSHRLRFQPLPGWIEPAEQDVLIVGEATRDLSFEYLPLPSYYFKGIPPQTAREGKPLRFLVVSSDPTDPESPAPGARLTARFSPGPAGDIAFDPDSGELRYEVDPQDRRDFTVTFGAAGTGGIVEGTVVISPAPELPPEDAVLQFDRPLPDPLSRDYLQIRESRSEAPETFNLRSDVHPRSVSISGRSLLFEAGSTKSDLHARYDGDDDVRELRLYAETITIRSPLRLPGTHVEVHARELRFEGPGALDVTPPDWFAGRPEPVASDGTFAASGANGLSSPPMELYLERLHVDPAPGQPGAPLPRLRLRGARAQDAGEGRNGRNLLQPGTVLCGSFNGTPIIYTACILPDGSRDNECGQPSVHGENAIPAGFPGRGGAGGTVTSPLGAEIAPLLDLAGGAHGQPGSDTTGGAVGGSFVVETWRTSPAGEPCAVVGRSFVTASRGAAGVAPSQPCDCVATTPGSAKPCGCVTQTQEDCDLVFDVVFQECATQCTSDGLPPRICSQQCTEEATRAKEECILRNTVEPCEPIPFEVRCTGTQGGIVPSPVTGAWLHPLLVRSTLLFVKDAYLNERIPEARAILEEYRTLIVALKSDLPPGDEADQFAQIGEEIESLLHRIDANLDYFGNPVTWVPLLSFEANLAAFTEEVDRAIPTLYLGYWVRAAAEQAGRTRDAAIAAMEKLDQELDALILEHAVAQEEMPVLLAEAEALEAKVTAATARLVALSADLERRAQENVEDRHKLPLWRKAVGVLGAATKIIPLAQPTLGFVGVGLGLLSKFDEDHPLANLDKLPDLIKAIKANPYALCARGKAQESKEDPKKEKKATLLERATACKTILQAGVKEIREVLKETQADKKEVEAELEKLRASDPIFVGATKEVEQLNLEKQQLGERVAATLDKLTRFSSEVNENVLTTTQLDRNLDATLDVIDHSSILHVADMARRTSDRLLSYQYLMAKAYQFRTLRPYTGNLHLGRILDRIRELVDAQDSAPILSPQQFDSLKAIYLEEVGRIAQDILDDLNVNGPEHSAPVSFRLTAQEVAALNTQGSLEVDLANKGLFGPNEEDLRIVSIESQELQVRAIGALGTTATLRLRMEHSGFSRITKGGQTYLFTHYRTERVNPITWTTVYDALGGTRTETEISAATESLLRFLLGLSSAQDVLLYSPPGALTKILLSKDVTADAGVQLEIVSLTLRLRYDYARANVGMRRLDVQVSDELGPRILLGGEDLNGRRDGVGGFVRTFAGPATVRLEAPPSHGIWAFDHWEVTGGGGGAGGGILDEPAIDVHLTANLTARAHYRSTVGPAGEGAFRRGDTSGDGRINLTDAVQVLEHLFLGGDAPACPDAADADDSGRLEITDAVRILGYLFIGLAEPPAPGPNTCGEDPTADSLAPCASLACP